MKKLVLAAAVSACSTFAFSQSVVTDPIGVKQKTVVKQKVAIQTKSTQQGASQNSSTVQTKTPAATLKHSSKGSHFDKVILHVRKSGGEHKE